MAQIVLVEDNDDIRSLLAAALTRAGHEVRTAVAHEEGLRLHAAATADVLVLDLCTPGIPGVVAIGMLRDQGDDTPIVAVSGAAFMLGGEWPPRRTMTAALDAGADAFLPKPFSTRTLGAVIARVLGADKRALSGCAAA